MAEHTPLRQNPQMVRRNPQMVLGRAIAATSCGSDPRSGLEILIGNDPAVERGVEYE
jgi:hypothetical protein